MKFNIGDKVIPIGDTYFGIKLDDSSVWQEAKAINQSYLYITHYDSDDSSYICRVNKDNKDDYGNCDWWDNYWFEKDLKLFKDSMKLIKELLNDK